MRIAGRGIDRMGAAPVAAVGTTILVVVLYLGFIAPRRAGRRRDHGAVRVVHDRDVDPQRQHELAVDARAARRPARRLHVAAVDGAAHRVRDRRVLGSQLLHEAPGGRLEGSRRSRRCRRRWRWRCRRCSRSSAAGFASAKPRRPVLPHVTPVILQIPGSCRKSLRFVTRTKGSPSMAIRTRQRHPRSAPLVLAAALLLVSAAAMAQTSPPPADPNAPPPVDPNAPPAGYPPPPNSGYPPPANSGYPPPANSGYPPPANNYPPGYTPPPATRRPRATRLLARCPHRRPRRTSTKGSTCACTSAAASATSATTHRQRFRVRRRRLQLRPRDRWGGGAGLHHLRNLFGMGSWIQMTPAKRCRMGGVSGSAAIAGIGPGIAYYIQPVNVFLSGTLAAWCSIPPTGTATRNTNQTRASGFRAWWVRSGGSRTSGGSASRARSSRRAR